MRNFWRVSLVLLLLLFLFRGPAFRTLTNYNLVNYRTIATNPTQRLQAISDSLYLESDDLEEFVLNAQDYTTGALQFSARNSGSSTLATLRGGQANCVGYARVMADLIQRNADKFPGMMVRHGVAKIFILGFDLHQLTDKPFWRDHDVVVVEAGDSWRMVVDPSLADYTGVWWVE